MHDFRQTSKDPISSTAENFKPNTSSGKLHCKTSFWFKNLSDFRSNLKNLGKREKSISLVFSTLSKLWVAEVKVVDCNLDNSVEENRFLKHNSREKNLNFNV